jgi:glycosyltransferase involved in cell wall biosynthesis
MNLENEHHGAAGPPRFKQQDALQREASWPRISVIIPAHNEESYLPLTLEALRAQTYSNFEVIVVANGCTDRTEEVARTRCDRLFSLEKGLSRARNIGAKKAQGDLLVFVDADTLLERTTLEIIARDFGRDCSGGTIRGIPDAPSFGYKLLYLWKNTIHQLGLHPGSSGVILCWRDHFRAVDGFDEGLSLRENSELMRRLGRFGKYKYLSMTAATTSMRRYNKAGWRFGYFWLKIFFISLFTDIRNHQYDSIR